MSGERPPLPWRRMFRRLSDQYGWTPQAIAELTLAQFFTYIEELDDLSQRVEVESLAAARALQARASQSRVAWERNFWRRVQSDRRR